MNPWASQPGINTWSPVSCENAWYVPVIGGCENDQWPLEFTFPFSNINLLSKQPTIGTATIEPCHYELQLSINSIAAVSHHQPSSTTQVAGACRCSAEDSNLQHFSGLRRRSSIRQVCGTRHAYLQIQTSQAGIIPQVYHLFLIKKAECKAAWILNLISKRV